MAKKYFALVNKDTNVVENYIVWDGVSEYKPGEIYDIIEHTDDIAELGVGMIRQGKAFIKVEQPPAKKTMNEYLREKYLADEGMEPD